MCDDRSVKLGQEALEELLDTNPTEKDSKTAIAGTDDRAAATYSEQMVPLPKLISWLQLE